MHKLEYTNLMSKKHSKTAQTVQRQIVDEPALAEQTKKADTVG